MRISPKIEEGDEPLLQLSVLLQERLTDFGGDLEVTVLLQKPLNM